MDKELLQKIEKTDTCWNWLGWSKSGYGGLSKDGKRHRAHRYIYELLVGKIPEGLEIDHLCRNKKCVNPEHLEPVTHSENMRRTKGFRKRKTHCVKGHEFTKENTRIVNDKKKDLYYPVCKICSKARNKKWTDRIKDGKVGLPPSWEKEYLKEYRKSLS